MAPHFWYEPSLREDQDYRHYVAEIASARRTPPAYARPGSPGHVAEFLKSGKPACGVLLQKGRRLRILDSAGREDLIGPEKLVDLSEPFLDIDRPKPELVEVLREVDRQRERLKTSIDVNELWEVIHNEGAAWTLEELCDLYFVGDAGAHGKAALFRALNEGHTFARHGDRFAATSPDRVAQRRQAEAQERRVDRWLHDAAAWLRQVADGEDVVAPVDAEQAVQLLSAKVLFGSDHPNAERANTLATAAHFHTRSAILDVLVKLGHWRADENLDLLRYKVATDFDESAQAEGEGAAWPRAWRKAPRLWWRRVVAVTDDQGLSKQALSIRRGWRGVVVGVHFASPALLVDSGSALDRAVADRGVAMHLPDQRVPMFPDSLFRRAALSMHDRRPCLTFHLCFDRRGDLTRWRAAVCRVRITHSLPPDADTTLFTRDWALQRLHCLAQRLRQTRIDDGAVILPQPDIAVRVEEGQTTLRRTDPDAPWRVTEEELSILANTLAGRFCLDHALPAIYRAQDRCAEIVTDPKVYDPVACHRQKRLMPRAVLQTEPAPRRRIGAEAYVPISRPLDRYADLLIHRQIANHLAARRSLFDKNALHQATLRNAYARDIARRVEANANRYWSLRYLEDKAMSATEAVILQSTGNGYRVQLTETGLMGFCPDRARRNLSTGTRIQVRIAFVSARDDRLQLQLAG